MSLEDTLSSWATAGEIRLQFHSRERAEDLLPELRDTAAKPQEGAPENGQ